MADIFLSYNREDQARATLFAAAFERAGFSVWWDVGLKAGESYDEATESALRSAKAVVVLWSKRSSVSRWVKSEATLGHRLGTLVPCMIEPCERPLMFELTQTADLSHWLGDDGDRAWLAFLDDVGRFVTGEPEQPKLSGQSAPTSPPEPVLAVLPFDNLSADPEMAFFSEGVSDEILQTVSRAVKTIGRTSSFHFRGVDKSLARIAQELNPTHILDGSVRQGAGLVRINAQLIETRSQATIWQNSYERPSTDLFAVQDEIAAAVASTLRCKLAPPSQEGIDPETYEIFLRLRQARLDWTLSPRKRLELADELTRRAPRFARGWLEAAQIRAAIRRNAELDPEQSRRYYDEMQEAITRAGDLLDEDDPHLTALVVNWSPWVGAWTACEKRLRRTLARFPHAAEPKGALATLLRHAGHMTESLELFQEAYSREPLSAVLAASCGMSLDAMQRAPEAFAIYEAAQRRWPENTFLWRCYVTTAAREQRWDIVDKLSAPERLARLQSHGASVEDNRKSIEALREPTETRRRALLQNLETEAGKSRRLSFVAIVEAAALCDLDAVYKIIDQACFAHLMDPLFGHAPSDLGVQALFLADARRLRSAPQFVKLCARLGIVSHWIETGTWPDCANEVPYDLRAEAQKYRDTPIG